MRKGKLPRWLMLSILAEGVVIAGFNGGRNWVYAQTTEIPIGAKLGTLVGGNPFKIDDAGLLLARGAQFLLIAAGVVTFGCVVWSGVQWVGGGGDKAAVQAARSRLTHCVVGLTIVATSLALINLMRYFLGVEW